MAILEPNDPSVCLLCVEDRDNDWELKLMCLQDVTEIIGSQKVDMGFKAMIHTLAVSLPHSSTARKSTDESP